SGKIWVESAEGHGSVFHFTIPAVASTMPQASRMTSRPQAAACRQTKPIQPLTAANLITWSRAAVATWLFVRATSAQPGPLSNGTWLSLLWSATAGDWLDGPLARRTGATRFGAVLDLEADSWLTLSAAMTAWRSGGLPAWGLVPPVLRYAVRWRLGLALPMANAGWQKAAGATQMAVLIGAVAPSRPLRVVARRICAWAVIGQLAALAADGRPLDSAPSGERHQPQCSELGPRKGEKGDRPLPKTAREPVE